MDLSVMCRSCMKELTSRESENFNKLAIDMFTFCTDVEVSEDIRLPKSFCSDCHIQIEMSYKFIQKAHKVNIAFNNIISRIDTKVIIETEKLNCDTKMYNDTDTFENYDSDNLYNEIMAGEELNDINLEKSDNKYSDIKIETTMQKEFAVSNKEDIREKYSNKVPTNVTKTDQKSCPICRKTFKSKVWLNKHISKSHTEDKIGKECPELFSLKTELGSHSTVHASPTQQLSCAACGEQFASHRQLAAHAQTHDNAAATRPYICDYCASSFKTKHHLRGHIKNLHTRDKPYLCNICGSSFSLAGNLKGHMATHSTAKPFACEHCPFATNSVYQLRRHRRRRHNPDTNYAHQCPHCSKAFFDSAGLVRHVRRHTGARPYKCSHCGRGFIDSWKRKLHLMRSHKMLLSELQRLPKDPCTIGTEDTPRLTDELTAALTTGS